MSRSRNERAVVVGILALSQLSLLATVAACGRTAGSNDQQLLELASKASTRLKAQNEKAADALINKNAVTTERLLRGLIDKEREERIAADKILSDRIDSLKAELSAFREEVNGRFDKIDKRDAALRSELENNFEELRSVDKELAASIEAEAKARIAELTKVRGEMTSLEGRVIDKITATEKSLKEQIDEQKATINAALEKAKQENQALISALNSSISDLGTKLEAEKAAGGENVKKFEQELSTLQRQLTREQDRVNQLEKAAAEEKIRLSRTIEQHDATRNTMRTEIQNLQNELRESKAALKEQLAALSAAERIERQAQAKALEEKLARLSDALKAENQALADKQEKLSQRAATLETRLAAEEKARSDAMNALEGKTKELLNTTDAKTRSELMLLINQAKESSGKSLESLQRQMMDKISTLDSDLRLELVKLTKGMSDIRQEAKATREDLEKKMLSNSSRIQDELKQKMDGMTRALDSARSEWDGKLARGLSGLSEDLTEKIRKAEDGLNEKIRGEIAARRLEIEGIKGSQRQAEENFAKQLDQAKRENNDKLIALKAELDASLQDNFSKFQDETVKNQSAIAALSKRLTEQQVAISGTQASYDEKIKKLSEEAAARDQAGANQKQALLDQMRAQREAAIAEYTKLQNDMVSLRSAQDVARNNLEKEMKEKLQAQSEENKAAMQTKISEVLARIDSIDSNTTSKMSELRTLFAEEKANTEAKILSGMKEIQEKLTFAAAETKKVSQRVDAVARAQKDFEAFASINYAAKGKLEAVELRAAGLEFVTQVMKADMERAPLEIKAMVSKELEERTLKLEQRVKEVNADQESIKSGLGSANAEFQSMVIEKFNQIRDELTKVKSENRKQDDALFAALSDATLLSSKVNADLMDTVKKLSVEFETVGQFKRVMSDKIVQLESQMSASDVEATQQFLELRVKFSDSVKLEQAFREQIGKELLAVKDELKVHAASAIQLLAVSNASAEDVKLLKSDLARVDGKLSVQEESTAARFRLQSAQITELAKSTDRMREDFRTKLNDVKSYAYDIAKGMGEEVQRELASSSAEIAKLKAVMKAEEAQLVNFYREMFDLTWEDVSDLVPEVAADQSLMLVRKDVVDGKSTVVGKGSLVRTLEAMAAVRTAFVAALQPRPMSATGERVEAYDASFVPLMVTCGGDPEASYANALGRSSFDFLADQYVESLVGGPVGSSVDSIFFKTAKMTDGVSLHHFIVLSALSRFWGGSESPSCMSAIRSWASSTMASESFRMQREALAKNTRLQSSVAEFAAASSELRALSNQMEQRFASRILEGGKFIAAAMTQDPRSRSRFGSDKVEEQAMMLLGSMAHSLNESADATYRMIQQQEKFNSILTVQREFAKAAVSRASEDPVARATLEQAERNLSSDIAALKSRLDAFEISYKDAAPSGLTSVDEGLGKTLDVVLSLSLRSGHPDLATDTVELASLPEVAPVVSESVKPSIKEIQHFFDDSRATANQSDTCTGKSLVSGAGVKFWSSTSSQCWVDFKSLKAGAANSASRTIWFRVFGSASQLNVASQLCAEGNSACSFAFTLDGSSIVPDSSRGGTVTAQMQSGTASQGVFDLRMPDVLQSKTTGIETIRFTATGSDGSERLVSDYKVQLYSPIVLDFMTVGRPNFTRLESSAVRFDLDGDGRAERTAWFTGYRDVGFLGLDLNGNGKLDDGRELFGEATQLQGQRGHAKDGYAALAQYDTNSDGIIDAQDSVFSKLLVWMDRNQDGRANTGELVSLKSAGVTRIGLSHSKLLDSERFVNGSELRTSAKFWGPKQCGTQGCNSYDVYLSTAFLVTQRK